MANIEFTVVGTCSSTVFHIRADGSTIAFSMTSPKGIHLKGVRWNDSIIVISSVGRQLLSYTFEMANSTTFTNEHSIISKIRKLRGQTIPINAEVLSIYKQSRRLPLIHKELERYVRIGSIPIQALTIIKKALGEMKNA